MYKNLKEEDKYTYLNLFKIMKGLRETLVNEFKVGNTENGWAIQIDKNQNDKFYLYLGKYKDNKKDGEGIRIWEHG